MQEEACARSGAAKGVSTGSENKKEITRFERSGHEKRTVWPRKIQNIEVDNDVIDVISVSSDSDLILRLRLLHNCH